MDRTMKRRLYIVGGLAWLAGAATGYTFAKRKLQDKYARIVDEELAKSSKYIKDLRKKHKEDLKKASGSDISQPDNEVIAEIVEDVVDETVQEVINEEITEAAEEAVQEAFEEGVEALVNYGARVPRHLTEEEKAQLVTVTKSKLFTDANQDIPIDYKGINLEVENELRARGKPYAIPFSFFVVNDDDNEQITITYYAGDSTLCDERDEPIIDIDTYVGKEALEKFGLGTDDDHVVYIRNDRLGIDFEVVRDSRKYHEDILGSIAPHARLSKFKPGG